MPPTTCLIERAGAATAAPVISRSVSAWARFQVIATDPNAAPETYEQALHDYLRETQPVTQRCSCLTCLLGKAA